MIKYAQLIFSALTLRVLSVIYTFTVTVKHALPSFFNRYGFVTFETQEDALKIINNVSSLVSCFGIFHAYNHASNLTRICCLYVCLCAVTD